MGLLTRDQILTANDLATKDVECPEWGGTVRVRALSVGEAQEWRRGMLKSKPKTDPKTHQITWDYEYDEKLAESSTLRMLVLACIDEAGNKLFTASDIGKLGERSAAPITRLVLAIKELSGLDEEAEENAEKNSEPNLSADSSSN